MEGICAIFVCLYLYCCWRFINWCSPVTFFYLSQTWTWISYSKCSVFALQLFEVRGCSFCWYWWNCWPPLLIFYFHKTFKNGNSMYWSSVLCV